jgi:hypothetical protein
MSCSLARSQEFAPARRYVPSNAPKAVGLAQHATNAVSVRRAPCLARISRRRRPHQQERVGRQLGRSRSSPCLCLCEAALKLKIPLTVRRVAEPETELPLKTSTSSTHPLSVIDMIEMRWGAGWDEIED